MIFKRGKVKREFVKDVLEFKSGQNTFIQGNGSVGIFGTEGFKSKVLAIRFLMYVQVYVIFMFLDMYVY